MTYKKTWKEFRDTGLLWWINRTLHLFGWVLVLTIDPNTNEIIECYPARSNFRGFSLESEEEGFKKLSKYLEDNATDLRKETED